MQQLPARRFAVLFLCIILAWVVAVGALTIWQQKVTGDLARVGGWSERDFGYHSSSPPFLTAANQEQGEADVAVLGDSFARSNIWQSILATSTGQKFRTWQFEDGLSCIRDWALKTTAANPSVRTVVIETVERAELVRAVDRYDCSPDRSSFHASQGAYLPMQRSYWPLTMDLDYVARTSLHEIRQFIWTGAEFRSEVVNLPLKRKGLFSNHESNRLLYLTDDEPPWRSSSAAYATAADNINDLNGELRQRGVRLVVIIVPDKSNVYRDEMIGGRLPPAKIDLAALLRSKGILSPDLLPAFRDRATHSVDFYLPDDTHLSLPGFEYLGNTLENFWERSGLARAG